MSNPQRLESLDLIRGIAILGIFIINLNYFAIPAVERYHPSVDPNLSTSDWWIWLLEYVLVKQRFMSIFALLFGAGIWMMADRYRQKGLNPTPIHLRRMGGLILIGGIHAYLIWDGDILVSYAMCGLLVYWLRNLNLRLMYFIGGLMILISFWEVILRMVQPLDVGEWLGWWNPAPEALEAGRTAHTGSWWEEFPARAAVAWQRETQDWLYFTIWRVGGLMLIGIAAMRTGFLAATFSRKTYLQGALITGIPGLALSLWGALSFVARDYDLKFFMQELSLSFWLGSVLMAFSYVCLVLFWVKGNWGVKIRAALSRIGRFSLSNYLLQSLIGTLLFFGYGFGLYGDLPRTELVAVILGVWTVQILLSWLWSRKFTYGPIEGLWRGLTYGKWPHWRK